jgi:ubiquinone/menaquinone biosynthesis C-methylase UbiE
MGLYSSYIFPRLLEWTLGTPMIQRRRRQALAGAEGSVLEVGFGTGLNLPHYPQSVTKITAVDPARALADRVEERINRSRIPVEQVQMDASLRLPFDDESFDCVVTTFTLCSIPDARAALREMRRVLKPSGRYIFLEHGRSDDPRTARRQDFFNPLQRLVGCGCNMNRRIDQMVREAEFEIVELDRSLLPDTPRVLGEIYRGAAKP